MNRLSLAFSFALAVTPAALATEAAAPRSFSTAMSLRGVEALRVDVAAPRIESRELDKMLADARLLSALNEKHLAKVGRLAAKRAFKLGTECFDPGDYEVSVSLDAEGRISVALTNGVGTTSIAMESRRTDAPVPQLTFSTLPEKDIETFQLEVRVGALRATAPIDFAAKRIIVHMNNVAHELLAKSDRNAKDSVRALALASRANAMTSSSNPLILDTYALALFHTGDVDQAIAAQSRAVELIDADYETHRPAMIGRLKAYRASKTN